MSSNLLSAKNYPDNLTEDLKNQIIEGLLNEISEVRGHFICSQLGLALKSN